MNWVKIVINIFGWRIFSRNFLPKLVERKKDISSTLIPDEISFIERGTNKSHVFTAVSLFLAVALLVFYMDFVFMQKNYISLGLIEKSDSVSWIKIIISSLSLMLASPILFSYLLHKIFFGKKAYLLLNFEKIADTKETYDSGKRTLMKGIYRTNFENLLPWATGALIIFFIILII